MAMLAACRSAQDARDQDADDAGLDTLLRAVLQDADGRERSLMARVQQQQCDLQALHSAIERDASGRQEQHTCLEQMQVCLHHHSREQQLTYSFVTFCITIGDCGGLV